MSTWRVSLVLRACLHRLSIGVDVGLATAGRRAAAAAPDPGTIARYLMILAFLPLLSFAPIAWGAEVQSVRIGSTPASTRLVFDVSKAVQYEVKTLDNPLRIVIDMRDTELGAHTDPQRLRIAGTPVSSVRSARQPDGSLRWVLELRVAATARSFALPPVVPYGHRLVLDLLPAQVGAPPIVAPPRATTVPVLASRAVGQPVAQPVTQPAARPSGSAPTIAARSPIAPPATAPASGAAAVPSASPSTASTTAPAPAPPTASVATTATSTTATAIAVGTSRINGSAALPPPTRTAAESTPATAPIATSRVVVDRAPVVDAPAAQPSAARTARPLGPVPGGSAGQPIVFAIDAGHGGQAPGALGPDGVREKDVVLATAKRLAELINAEPGFKAILTRTGDYFIPLRERPRLARAAGAHFFVSVHADAHSNTDARGASVYALSERGATSETAKWLAERENNSDLVGGVSLDNKDRMLAEVLLDLSMTASLTESLELGSLVLSELKELTHLHSRRVEQAGFMVLKSPDIPSILIETGYVSNPIEAAKLANPEYRDKLARAIFRGLTAQALRRPPQGTSIAARSRDQPAKGMQSPATDGEKTISSQANSNDGAGAALARDSTDRAYVVAAGDTLRTISERFGVSLRVIRRLNAMRTDRVRVGQTLRLPPASGES